MSKSIHFSYNRELAQKTRNCLTIDDDILAVLSKKIASASDKYPIINELSQDFYQDCIISSKQLPDFEKELSDILEANDLELQTKIWIQALVAACSIGRLHGLTLFCFAD